MDSQSGIFCVNDATSMRRSAWLLGKVEFVHEAHAMGHIRADKIETEHNTSDGKTKVVDVKTYWRHLSYTHNVSFDELRGKYGLKTELGNAPLDDKFVCVLLS